MHAPTVTSCHCTRTILIPPHSWIHAMHRKSQNPSKTRRVCKNQKKNVFLWYKMEPLSLQRSWNVASINSLVESPWIGVNQTSHLLYLHNIYMTFKCCKKYGRSKPWGNLGSMISTIKQRYVAGSTVVNGAVLKKQKTSRQRLATPHTPDDPPQSINTKKIKVIH